MRIIFLISGFTALFIAILGIFLPLLPTTPLLLLSAFCFARSSEKFHDWLLEHPYFGQNIKDWQERGAISKKAKITAMITIIATFLLSVFLQVKMIVLIIQLVVLCCVSTFILTRPHS